MTFKYDKAMLSWIQENADKIDEAIYDETVFKKLYSELNSIFSWQVIGQFAYFLLDEIGVNVLEILKNAHAPGYTYLFCFTPISNIEFPDHWTYIPWQGFRECTDLVNIKLPQSLEKIGDFAFFRTNLKEIILPSNVYSIGQYAFYDCKNLQSVKLNESLHYIGEGAFEECKNLKKIIIPDSVTFLNADCFRASGIEEVIYPKNCELVAARSFLNCANLKTVVVNDGCYKIEEEAFLNCDKLLLELPQSISVIENHIIGTLTGRKARGAANSTGNNTKIKVRGLSKEQAKEFFEAKVNFKSAAIKSRCIKALV